uniref:Secreted protein n=1 Tax=Anguilla anguilla TaxID=7936 RepID=A0A0E9R6Q5_ANGAN
MLVLWLLCFLSEATIAKLVDVFSFDCMIGRCVWFWVPDWTMCLISGKTGSCWRSASPEELLSKLCQTSTRERAGGCRAWHNMTLLPPSDPYRKHATGISITTVTGQGKGG